MKVSQSEHIEQDTASHLKGKEKQQDNSRVLFVCN
jgi:hypothetical protein